MQKVGIIDRFEGEYAVVEREDQGMLKIPRSELPHDAHEGDVLVRIDGVHKVDPAETAK